MKLIIQIPCLNEEKTLPIALDDLPKAIEGIDEIEYLIINDGSDDKTITAARNWGVDYIVSFHRNRGLASAFMAGPVPLNGTPVGEIFSTASRSWHEE